MGNLIMTDRKLFCFFFHCKVAAYAIFAVIAACLNVKNYVLFRVCLHGSPAISEFQRNRIRMV